MASLQPLGDNIVVQTVVDEAKTASGVIIPSTASKEKPQQGKVVAVGRGKLLENGKRAEFDVKVGDTVIFNEYAPKKITLEDEEYLILSQSDVLAIVK